VAAFLVFFASRPDLSAATNETPDFREVYDLIRAHAAGVSDAELNRAAVQGLLAALGPKASLVNGAPTNAPAETPLVSQTRLFDGNLAYLRVARVGDGLAKEVNGKCQQLNSTNKLKGVVLDLRYADGTDYAAAAATADLFSAKSEPLLNWGSGMVSSHEKTNSIRAPVAVLVNRETARAAEALTALLRQTGAGLILGGRTAGQALITQDFPLKEGGQLRIATAPVTLGDGATLPVQGIKPDIDVAVSPEDELAYYADAFAVLPRAKPPAGATPLSADQAGGTNLAARRDRMSEAELVREHKQGNDFDRPMIVPVPPPRPAEPEKPVVNDPVLARALDLLKGLAVVRQDRF
jgi:hypothetical protein